MFLYCADPLHPRRVDPHFAAEAATVRDLGGTVALLDHDALLAGDPATATGRVPRDRGPLWYRGWMIPTPHYAALATALAARGATLRTSPDMYRAAHELPGWYDAFAEVTPASAWLPWSPGVPVAPGDVAALAAGLPAGPGLVKDYVKSRKHEWATACHIPDLADTAAAHRVVSRFVELQDTDLAGGLVLRAFEDLRGPAGRRPAPGGDGPGHRHAGDVTGPDPGTGGPHDPGDADASPRGSGRRPAEARVWWLDGAPVLTGPHPDTPDQPVTPDLSAVGPLVAAFDARFVTTDLAQRADGAWRLIEVGDAQVSDLPAGVDPAPLIAALLGARP
ncbi:ATP-grasp domain-containing protein [Longispora sp. K20-0274]|uniref:ATP-grasp domain-containing protein n=1 Tax=Longispora sp. K20-0274 TaxID=3088255 RepID=UPI00399A3341